MMLKEDGARRIRAPSIDGLDRRPSDLVSEAGQDRGSLRLGALELGGIEAERTQDRRCNLLVLNLLADHAAFDPRVGDNQQDVGIVVAEAAMLGDLLRAAAIDRAVDRLDDDV